MEDAQPRVALPPPRARVDGAAEPQPQLRRRHLLPECVEPLLERGPFVLLVAQLALVLGLLLLRRRRLYGQTHTKLSIGDGGRKTPSDAVRGARGGQLWRYEDGNFF